MYALGVEGDETLLAQQQHQMFADMPPAAGGNGSASGGVFYSAASGGGSPLSVTTGAAGAPYGLSSSGGGPESGMGGGAAAGAAGYLDEEPSPRGEEHTPLIHLLTRKLLRLSLSLKTVAMALMCIFFLAFGGRWVFTFHAYPEMSNGFHLTMVVLMTLYLIGTVLLALFQAFVADDSKWTKGFRTGSKILSAATTLDAMAAMLRLVEYLYLFNYLSVAWWSKFNVSKSEWLLFTVSNLLDGLALLSYAWAFFYMEVYHDEGTFEELAWLMFSLFSVSGCLMILMVFSGFGAVFMLLTVAGAYATACYWAYLFEPLLDKWSPELHCRDINTDIVLPGGGGGGGLEGLEEETAATSSQSDSYYYGGGAGGGAAAQGLPGAAEGTMGGSTAGAAGLTASPGYAAAASPYEAAVGSGSGSPSAAQLVMPASAGPVYQAVTPQGYVRLPAAGAEGGAGGAAAGGAAAVGGPAATAGNVGVQYATSAGAAGQIPTHYDYSQLQQQVAQGVEMGVLNTNYQ